MTNTPQNTAINKKDIIEAAKRVVKDTRPEEIELMDEAELEAYNRAKQILIECGNYNKKRSSR